MPMSFRSRPYSAPVERHTQDPEPTDADDSIVLSDLVRTGEASRLRRRGAMRLDHATTLQPMEPPRASSPTVIVVGSPTWESDTEAPVFSPSERNRSSRYSRREPKSEDCHYALFCGGEYVDNDSIDQAERPYVPSVLPMDNSFVPYSAPSTSKLKSTGCGAIIHMRATPRPRLCVWTAKTKASDAVVPMDASYFDSAAVAKIVRSACGCIREGVGCAVCGNPLGTRYRPCKTAADGLFTYKPQSSVPIHPQGPRYWHPHSPSNAECHIYTFFANSVTSGPTYSFPTRSQHRSHSSLSYQTSPTWYFDPPQPVEEDPIEADTASNEAIFDRGISSSPLPLSETGDADDSETYRGSALYLQVPYSLENSAAMQNDFDPDGMDLEPSSPDKTGEPMLFPER